MEKLKQIISQFINKPISEISESTVIDKRAIQGSILIHRMYAELAENGYRLDNYSEIKTFGELTSILFGSENKNETKIDIIPEQKNENSTQIGIDIENITNFKQVPDFREDEFYKQNFSQKEISYSILQPNPIQTFAGKFSAKEAIVKADNKFKNIPFNQIEILNDEFGKPIFNDFTISISHSQNTAVAVAIKQISIKNKVEEGIVEKEVTSKKIKYLIYFFIFVSLVSIFLNIYIIINQLNN